MTRLVILLGFLAACASVSPTAVDMTDAEQPLALRIVDHGDGVGRDTIAFYFRGPNTFSWSIEAREPGITSHDSGTAHSRVNYVATYSNGSPVTFVLSAWTALDTLTEQVTR